MFLVVEHWALSTNIHLFKRLLVKFGPWLFIKSGTQRNRIQTGHRKKVNSQSGPFFKGWCHEALRWTPYLKRERGFALLVKLRCCVHGHEFICHTSGGGMRGTPFYAGEEAFMERASVRPGAVRSRTSESLTGERLKHLEGSELLKWKSRSQWWKGGYFTGNIERVTDYEKVPSNLLVERGDKLELIFRRSKYFVTYCIY